MLQQFLDRVLELLLHSVCFFCFFCCLGQRLGSVGLEELLVALQFGGLVGFTLLAALLADLSLRQCTWCSWWGCGHVVLEAPAFGDVASEASVTRAKMFERCAIRCFAVTAQPVLLLGSTFACTGMVSSSHAAAVVFLQGPLGRSKSNEAACDLARATLSAVCCRLRRCKH